VSSDRGAATRQQLLDAAVSVFSRMGYARATTREIAQTAGVAEGTIYRHFADKRELFREALASVNPMVLDEFLGLAELAGQATIRDNLIRFITVLEDIERSVAPLQASMWSDAELAQGLVPEGQPAAGGPGMALKPLAAYLAAEQKLGRIREDVDCEHAAFALFAIAFTSVMMGRMSQDHTTEERPSIMPMVDVVLGGLLPSY